MPFVTIVGLRHLLPLLGQLRILHLRRDGFIAFSESSDVELLQLLALPGSLQQLQELKLDGFPNLSDSWLFGLLPSGRAAPAVASPRGPERGTAAVAPATAGGVENHEGKQRKKRQKKMRVVMNKKIKAEGDAQYEDAELCAMEKAQDGESKRKLDALKRQPSPRGAEIVQCCAQDEDHKLPENNQETEDHDHDEQQDEPDYEDDDDDNDKADDKEDDNEDDDDEEDDEDDEDDGEDGQGEPTSHSWLLPSLRRLSLGGSAITDVGLATILSVIGCQLEELGLQHCNHLTEKGIAAIPRHCRKLQSLNLTGSRGVSDGTMRRLLSRCPGIARLVVNNTQVSDRFLRCVAAWLGPRLRELAVQRCGFLTDRGFAALSAACSNLVLLSVAYCRGLTDNGLQLVSSLASRPPHFHCL
eukprot:GHVT01064998.1.p1 GENE.GHVT01064998.1~~GHVT01064998.1.p1  ORF type:complete len:414 (+),score=91.07 GHVT01064998.1:320-1561(+)